MLSLSASSNSVQILSNPGSSTTSNASAGSHGCGFNSSGVFSGIYSASTKRSRSDKPEPSLTRSSFKYVRACKKITAVL